MQERVEFNTTAFKRYLNRLLQDYQRKQPTEFEKGAIHALLSVSVEFNRLEKNLLDEMGAESIEEI